ncbi:MAG TPA: VWA domain-containing protein, partial [Pyrinomonadaceae bacterium]|nr:VWA domain-containing protein [Pyrinomonadaceae bacterium]
MKKVVGIFLFLSLVVVSQSFISFAQKPVTKSASKPKPVIDNRDTLEMVFVLDTTGSMGGLIDGAKQRIWGIINDVMQKPSKPRVRVGLVAYRDNGDEYVTKLLPITEDLDKVYTTLMDYRADGGGDTPEN